MCLILTGLLLLQVDDQIDPDKCSYCWVSYEPQKPASAGHRAKKEKCRAFYEQYKKDVHEVRRIGDCEVAISLS